MAGICVPPKKVYMGHDLYRKCELLREVLKPNISFKEHFILLKQFGRDTSYTKLVTSLASLALMFLNLQMIGDYGASIND